MYNNILGIILDLVTSIVFCTRNRIQLLFTYELNLHPKHITIIEKLNASNFSQQSTASVRAHEMSEQASNLITADTRRNRTLKNRSRRRHPSRTHQNRRLQSPSHHRRRVPWLEPRPLRLVDPENRNYNRILHLPHRNRHLCLLPDEGPQGRKLNMALAPCSVARAQ